MKALFYSSLIVTFLLTNCSVSKHTHNDTYMEEFSNTEQQMTNESTDFAFRFFHQVNSSEKGQPNWLISPLSAGMALGMVTNGAEGNTLAEMKTTLGFSHESISEMNAYYHKLLTNLPKLDNSTRLGLANSIWIKKGFKVNRSFVKVNQRMYDAEVSTLDFSSPKAPATINDWCADKTNGLITEVIDNIMPTARMFLLNALYFKGIWKNGYEFEKENTENEQFSNADGSLSMVPMMNQKNRFAFCENEDFKIARFDYGNGTYSMTVLLPRGDLSLDNSLKSLTPENWRKWNDEMNNETLIVKFPRLEIEYNKELIKDFEALGMRDAFNGNVADFSNISSEGLYIGLLKQFTYMKVDEEGTEAAAVTVVGVMKNAAPPRTAPKEFFLNKPFAFLITENSTGSILFMGKVTGL